MVSRPFAPSPHDSLARARRTPFRHPVSRSQRPVCRRYVTTRRSSRLRPPGAAPPGHSHNAPPYSPHFPLWPRLRPGGSGLHRLPHARGLAAKLVQHIPERTPHGLKPLPSVARLNPSRACATPAEQPPSTSGTPRARPRQGRTPSRQGHEVAFVTNKLPATPNTCLPPLEMSHSCNIPSILPSQALWEVSALRSGTRRPFGVPTI